MWLQPVTRRELVEVLTPRKGYSAPTAVQEHRPSLDIVRADHMAAIWPMRPDEFGQIPTAIVIPDGTRRDTLAWLATYVRDFRPFTAFCRVVERSLAEQFISRSHIPSVQGIEGIYSGLVLGEALAHSRGAVAKLGLPTTTYTATLSHTIGRTTALVGNSIQLEIIARLWAQARELTHQPSLPIPAASIQAIWAIVLGLADQMRQQRALFDTGEVLTAAWRDYSQIGTIRESIWRGLTDGLPELLPLRALPSLPREQRVEGVELALRLLISPRIQPDDRRAFLAGYFASLLAPGTLDLADVLVPLAPVLPVAYVWYGLFAGTTANGDALPSGNPLARRLVRDLSVPDRLIDQPRCDIALEELAIFPLLENILKMTGEPGRLVIDILPGVTVSVRWPPHVAAKEDELRKEHQEREKLQLLAEMEDISMRQRILLDRLRIMLSVENDKRSPSESKRKRGGKT